MFCTALDAFHLRILLGLIVVVQIVRCYEQGWGVAADAGRATVKFEIAAERGHLWAQVNLAQMLMRAGAPQDRPRCFALFKAAAEGGSCKANIKAMNSLASFLEEGWAGTPDLDGAAFWYLRAADAGDHWAQFNLGTIFFQQDDHVAADKCFRSAIATGDNGFRRRVAELLLDRPELEQRLHGIEALRRDLWSVQASYTYMDGKIVSSTVNAFNPVPADGNRMPYVSRNGVSLWTTYEITPMIREIRGARSVPGQLLVGTGINYRSDYYVDNANMLRIPAATTLDAMISYDFDRYHLAVNVTNLTNELAYSSAFNGYATPVAGRTVTGTFRINLF